MRTDVLAIANLTKLSRLQSDALRYFFFKKLFSHFCALFRCDELASAWREERDLTRRAELVAELNSIVKANDKLKHVSWSQSSKISL